MFKAVPIIIIILIIFCTFLAVMRIKKMKVIEKSLLNAKNKVIGEIGEGRTAEEFKRFFKSISSECRILRNVYIKYGNRVNTEIDILIISEYGIFIIENKNYHGKISGSIKNELWTYVNSKNKVTRFPNPINQSVIHMKAIKNYMDFRYYDKIYPYIVFNDDCEISRLEIYREPIKIILTNEIYSTLWHDINKKIILPEEIETIYQSLYKLSNIALREEKENFIQNI